MACGQYNRLPAVSQGHITLSTLFRDPAVAAAFRRAERDNGEAFAVPAPVKPLLPHGAEVVA